MISNLVQTNTDHFTFVIVVPLKNHVGGISGVAKMTSSSSVLPTRAPISELLWKETQCVTYQHHLLTLKTTAVLLTCYSETLSTAGILSINTEVVHFYNYRELVARLFRDLLLFLLNDASFKVLQTIKLNLHYHLKTNTSILLWDFFCENIEHFIFYF